MKSSRDIEINVMESDKWTTFRSEYLDEELNRERRDLGGVRVRQEQNTSEEPFDFSIEEIRSRFSAFLNPEEDKKETDTERPPETIENGSEDPFDAINPDNSELFGTNNSPHDPTFNANNYWKIDVEAAFSADDLLAQLSI